MLAIRLFFQLSKESIRMAMRALVENKLRTFLSMLGIAMGIFCIVLVSTVVDSMKTNVNKSFESFGQNVIYVQKWPWIFSDNYPWWKYLNRPKATPRESEQLRQRLKDNALVHEVGYMTRVWGKTLKAEGETVEGVAALAVSYEYREINTVNLARGRYFTYFESRQGSQVIILGHTLANTLFPGREAVGKEVMFMGRKMTVIGVMALKGKSLFGPSEDELVIIPLNFLKKIVSETRFGEPSILVKGKENVKNIELEYAVLGAMRSIRRLRPQEDQDFALNKITMITGALDAIFGVLSIAGNVIGGFAILVGGFGIANIMFVSVKERTNLIGIQKALGAKRSFILFQFLIEAIVLSVIGGLAGIVLVALIASVATKFSGFEIILTAGNFIYGNIISISIGLLAGLIPAYSASRLDPVEAIRSKG